MGKWPLVSFALVFLTISIQAPAADAQSAPKPKPATLTAEKAMELAQRCNHLLLSTDQGLDKLQKLTHSLATLNKQYHRDREAWETSWKTLNKEAGRYNQTYAKWWARQAPCNDETALKMAMAGRSLTPWKKVRRPFESVMQYEQRMRDREWEERKRWGRDIPECMDAGASGTPRWPLHRALKERDAAYYEMAKQFEQTGRIRGIV
jgi:hypothetical protein